MTRREEHTEHGRSDPTRARRLSTAIRLTEPLVDDMLPLVECVLGNGCTDDESLKAAALAAYEKASGILTEVGLEVRQRALQYTVMDVPGRTAALRIDVEFALAASLDGRDAPLEWERRSYIGCDAEASERVLYENARRYWVCDTLMLLTEADAYPPEGAAHAPAPRAER